NSSGSSECSRRRSSLGSSTRCSVSPARRLCLSSTSFGRMTPSELPILRMVTFMARNSYVITHGITWEFEGQLEARLLSLILQQLVEQPFSRFRDDRAGRENFGSTGLQHRLVIVRRDDAARHDHHVVTAETPQRLLQLGDQRQM